MSESNRQDGQQSGQSQQYYRVKDVAARLGMCRNTATKYLKDDPEVLRRHGKKLTTLSIPESSIQRLIERLHHDPLQPAAAGGNPLGVVHLGDLDRGVTKKPRNIIKLNARCKKGD